MKNGNKQKSEKILLTCVKKLQKENKKNHLNIIKLAVVNAAPSIKLKEIKRRKRKTKKYLPYVLNKKNRLNEAIKLILNNIEKKQSIKFVLSSEIILSAEGNPKIDQSKLEQHEAALMKKKYLNFRWFC